MRQLSIGIDVGLGDDGWTTLHRNDWSIFQNKMNPCTVPLRSLESPSGFSISARVNFRLVFWLPKFENLKEINADLISSSKLNCLFAEFFFDFFLRGVYLKRMQPKYGITASTPMLSYEKTLKFNMLFSPPIFKLGHLNFNWW